MVERLVSIPAWVDDVVKARAKALDISYDEALSASLDIRVSDPMAQSAGWAVEHGQTARVVARRLSYSMTTVRDAAHRYQRSQRRM